MLRALLGISFVLPNIAAQAAQYETLALRDGASLEYAIVRPADFDPEQAYPVLLALPPGRQDRAMVEAGLARYWGDQAAEAGWVVVSPIAKEGTSFFSGAEQQLPELLDEIRKTIRVEGGRLYLAGGSNGGRSAFKVALAWPHEFRCLLALPGFADEADHARLGRLIDLDVRLYTGGEDKRWIDRVLATAKAMGAADVRVSYRVLPGEGHVPPSLDGGVVMEELELIRQAARPSAETAAVHAALDDFHDAACKGDEERYFGRFAPEGVFLGTDPSERWDLAGFKDYAMEYFQRPSAWIYVPRKRNVALTPDGGVAWFDEVVTNRSYGDCRGTGVLRKDGDRWLLCQYDLTVPVPNDLMGAVVARIRAHAAGALAAEGVTVIAVRHAEKETGDDPGLTAEGRARTERLVAMLRALPVAAVLSSPFQRTTQTAAPVAAAFGLEVETLPAKAYDEWAERIAEVGAGKIVVVVGHSNTVPDLLRHLGVAAAPDVSEAEYDHLFVARLGPDGGLLDLRY